MITLISRSKDQVLLSVIMACQKLVSICSVKKHKKHPVLDIIPSKVHDGRCRKTDSLRNLDKDISLLCACAYVWEY